MIIILYPDDMIELSKVAKEFLTSKESNIIKATRFYIYSLKLGEKSNGKRTERVWY